MERARKLPHVLFKWVLLLMVLLGCCSDLSHDIIIYRGASVFGENLEIERRNRWIHNSGVVFVSTLLITKSSLSPERRRHRRRRL